MKTAKRTSILTTALVATLSLAGLAGCEDETAAEEVQDDLENAVDETGDALEEGADELQDAAEEGVEEVEEAAEEAKEGVD